MGQGENDKSYANGGDHAKDECVGADYDDDVTQLVEWV